MAHDHRDRDFEAEFKLTLEAARRTLAGQPPISMCGTLTSPYGRHLAPLALMMRELHPQAPYTWDEIARGMSTGREALAVAVDDIFRELDNPQKRRAYDDFTALRRSLG